MCEEVCSLSWHLGAAAQLCAITHHCCGSFQEAGESLTQAAADVLCRRFNVDLMHQGDHKVEQHTNTNRVT